MYKIAEVIDLFMIDTLIDSYNCVDKIILFIKIWFNWISLCILMAYHTQHYAPYLPLNLDFFIPLTIYGIKAGKAK